MKLLLLIVGIAFGFHVSAQQPLIREYKVDNLVGQMDKKKMDSLIQHYLKKFPDKRIAQDVRPKTNPGVIYLADGMPCIVPEKATAALIPNAWQGKATVPFKTNKAPIPNPALPDEKFSFNALNLSEKAAENKGTLPFLNKVHGNTIPNPALPGSKVKQP